MGCINLGITDWKAKYDGHIKYDRGHHTLGQDEGVASRVVKIVSN